MLMLVQVTLFFWAVFGSHGQLHMRQRRDFSTDKTLSKSEDTGLKVSVVMLNWERPQNVIRIGQLTVCPHHPMHAWRDPKSESDCFYLSVVLMAIHFPKRYAAQVYSNYKCVVEIIIWMCKEDTRYEVPITCHAWYSIHTYYLFLTQV